MTTILDEGAELTLATIELIKLTESDTIYWCPECSFYHISPGKTWDDVDKLIQI